MTRRLAVAQVWRKVVVFAHADPTPRCLEDPTPALFGGARSGVKRSVVCPTARHICHGVDHAPDQPGWPARPYVPAMRTDSYGGATTVAIQTSGSRRRHKGLAL